jgi:DNA-binding transcriptional MerR regulator
MTISEVSEKYDISAETLRYYERVGVIPSVNRNENGIRDYTEIDCNWVQFIKCMRNAGLSIESLIEYTTLFKKGSKTHSARKQILIEQRDELVNRISDMQTALNRLNKKIDGYDETMKNYEEKNLK